MPDQATAARSDSGADGRDRRTPLDVALLLAVPVVLTAIHLLVPADLRGALVFDHDRFAGYTLLTAAYLHASDAHLVGNLVGYLLAGCYTYMLCTAAGRRRWFRRTFLLAVTALPVAVNLGSYALFAWQYPATSPTSRGFSGAVAGLGGFLLVALAVYVRTRYDSELAWAVGGVTFLLLLTEVDYIYAGRLRPVVGGLVLLGLVLLGGGYCLDHRPGVPPRRAAVRDLGVGGLVVVVLSYVVAAMFPADVAASGTFTNIFAHGLGFLAGMALALGTLAVQRDWIHEDS